MKILRSEIEMLAKGKKKIKGNDLTKKFFSTYSRLAPIVNTLVSLKDDERAKADFAIKEAIKAMENLEKHLKV